MGALAALGALGAGGGGLSTALTIGTSILSGVAGMASQNAAADAQEQANANEQARQAEYARQRDLSLKLQQESLRTKEQQDKEGLARESFKATREREQARSTGQVAASAGGVSGKSIGVLLDDFNLQTSFFTESQAQQSDFLEQQNYQQLKGASQQRTFDISNVLKAPEPVSRPSFLGTALRITGDIFGGLK